MMAVTVLIPVRVSARTEAAENVAVLKLEPVNAAPLPGWGPGDHVDLHLPSGLIRQYSLCGAPDDGAYRIAVLRQPDGRGGSREVCDVLREGHRLEVAPPRSAFSLQPAPHYLFVAGGIGITPILPMLAQADRLGADWKLFYAGRRRAAMPFLDELAAHDPDRIVLFPGDEGRRIEITQLLEEAGTGKEIYACGPARLLTALEAAFGNAGLFQHLHSERFTAGTEITPGEAFILELAQSGRSVAVPAETSILDALREVGIDWPSSCERGICGACEAVILEGKADHRDQVLTPEECAEGRLIMPCVSRARSAVLKLDI